MKAQQKTSYEIDPHNRLIAKSTGKASKVTGFRKILDGRFGVGEDNSLSYLIKKSADYDAPQQIRFSGDFSLDGNRNLVLTLNKWNNQVEGNKLVIKSSILDAKEDELSFSVQTRDVSGKSSVYILKLNGVWRADTQNRLSFEITKEKSPTARLTLQGSWKLNDNNEITYTHTPASQKRTAISAIIFKGQWEITDNQKITYILNKKINSGFDFSGRWKLNERLGLFFEIPFKGNRPKNVSFGADCKFAENNAVEFKLKNSRNKNVDMSLRLSRNILKGAGKSFAQALKDGKEVSFVAGAGFRW